MKSKDGALAKIFNIFNCFKKNEKNKATYVGFSGTPETNKNISTLHCVPMKIGEGYCGYNFHNGEILDKEAKTVEPLLCSYTEIAENKNIPFLKKLVVSCWYNEGSFEKNKDAMGLSDMDWALYEFKCNETIISLIIYLLIKHNPQKGQGMVIRLRNNNLWLKNTLHYIKSRLNDLVGNKIKVLNYTDEQVRTPVKKFLNDNEVGNTPFVVFLTNSGRMADSFPSSCKYFFEGSTNPKATVRSILQGLLGRASGYGKGKPHPPMVILCDDHVHEIEIGIKKNGIFRMPTHTRVENLKGSLLPTKGRPATNILLNEDNMSFTPLLQNAWGELQNKICDKLPPPGKIDFSGKPPAPKGGKKGLQKYKYDFWGIVNLEVRQEITKVFIEEGIYPEFELLRPDGVDEDCNGKRYHLKEIDGQWLQVLGFRSEDRQAARNSAKSDRETQEGAKGNLLEIQCHIAPNLKNDGWELRNIKLKTRMKIRPNKLDFNPIANKHSVYNNGLTDKERKNQAKN